MKKIVLAMLTGILLLGLIGRKSNQEENEMAENTTETEVKAEVKTVKLDNVEMDYAVFGSGSKSFVIIPGLSIHSVMPLADSIAEAYASFASEYTVYVFDRAKNIQEGYSILDMANDTAKVMKELNIENADIFGASQGGMIAQYIAINYPELVHKMVLGSTLSRATTAFKEVVEEWVTLAENKEEEKLLESFVDQVYSANTLEAYRDVLISSNLGITDEEYERFIILAKACESFDSYDELNKITCKTLVLGSNGDKVVGVEGSKELAEALDAEIYLYDDSYGHGVYDEASDYKQKCLDFFHEN